MVNDVFKFPDGNGGFILKIMGPDAKWHVCDEKGNYEEETPELSEPEEDRRRERSHSSRRTHREQKGDSDSSFRFCIRALEKDGILINDYVAWKSLQEHRNISRSDVMLKATLSLIKRDADFNAFMKNQKK